MSESEIDLDNLPLAEALRFADEGSTTGGLVTRAALKTLAAGCRELTAARAEIVTVTEQRDRLAEALQEYREALSDGPENCSYKMYEAVDEFAEKALQSLTTKEQ